MAKHFKPIKKSHANTFENTLLIVVDKKATNRNDLFQEISRCDLPLGAHGFAVDDPAIIDVVDLFFEGVEKVYIFDKDDVQFNWDDGIRHD